MLRELWRTRKPLIASLIVILALASWATVFLRQAKVRQAQRHIDAGIEYVRKGQPVEAEREWREAARLNPNDANLWDLLATLYMNTEQWNKGTEALQQLLRVAPNRPYLYSRLAACALRIGNELEAKRLAEEELKRNPDDEGSLTILAFLSSMQNSSEQQIIYLKRFLVRHPDDVDTLESLAQAYNESGKYMDVLPVVDHLLAIKPNDGMAYTMRGAARFETDASPAASAQSEADLLKALQANPLSAFARFTLGRVYLRQAQFPKAIFQLELAQKLSPRKMDVPFELATAYARSGQPAKAAAARKRFETLRQEATQISVLQKRCSLNPNDFAAHLQIGQLMQENGNYRSALYYLQHAMTLDPNNAAAKDAYQKLVTQINGQKPSSP